MLTSDSTGCIDGYFVKLASFKACAEEFTITGIRTTAMTSVINATITTPIKDVENALSLCLA